MFPQEPVPDRIGTYQVLKCVGRSGAADIYVARAEGPMGFSRDVTLKMVRYAIEDDARFAEELSREAAICARLNHPVVVRMFDFFEHDRRLVLVLEQVEGASLDRLQSHLTRRKQKLADNAIFYIGMQLASALAHAHSSTDEDGNLSPVIHRDLKPENVLVGWDGAIRLAGFGLGKILGHTPDSVAGTIRGTPGYMSPEQARGERATVRSDVYGFGMLLWSLLVGKEPPLDGVKPQPLGELRPDLPRELHMAVDAALEPSPDKRRITCAEIAQWLAKLTKIETGREELRQKVLWLRATRGPASKVDPSAKAVRPPKRRAAIQATRARRTSRPPSSVRAGPASSRPMRGTSEFPSSPPSSSRAVSVREGSGLLRIPPPPPVPHDDDAPTRQHTLPMAPSPFAQAPVAPTFGAPPQVPRSVRPAGVNVRTVSTPPPRTIPPLRPVLSAEDVLASTATSEPSDGWRSQTPTQPPERLTDAVSTYDSNPGQGAITQRPNIPQQPTFTITTQLLLAGMTAALVVAIGLLFLQRQPQQMTMTAAPPQIVTVEVSRPEPPREPQPAKTVDAPPPPTPTAAVMTAPQPPQMPDPSTLQDGLGYLMVKGPTNADVYLNGMRKGPTNEPLMVPCGQFFMRLALPNASQARYPSWLGPGESAFVSCKSSTVLIAKPIRSDAIDLSGTKM